MRGGAADSGGNRSPREQLRRKKGDPKRGLYVFCGGNTGSIALRGKKKTQEIGPEDWRKAKIAASPRYPSTEQIFHLGRKEVDRLASKKGKKRGDGSASSRCEKGKQPTEICIFRGEGKDECPMCRPLLPSHRSQGRRCRDLCRRSHKRVPVNKKKKGTSYSVA